jgi:hypothetical protein
MSRVLIAILAVALLGAAFSPARIEPAMLHVRWAIHHRDLTATAELDIPAAHDSVANVPGLFPMTERRTAPESHQHVRIVVAGKTLFDRPLTREETRRLGHLQVLHVANDVRGAGERDLVADGTAMLQYRAAPPGYRIVRATIVNPFARSSRITDCDRKGSFELERVASYAGTTARIVQRGASFNCFSARPSAGEFAITSAGRTVYSARATITERGVGSPPGAAGNLQITDGPVFVDFEGTGAPSIVLTGTTGGAHCCFDMHVYYRSTRRAYAETVRGWGNGLSYPVLLRDARSGEVVLGSSNDAFSYLYTGYANAVEPVQIFAFERGRFLDVTPDFPDIVRAQADRIWKPTRALLRAGKVDAAVPGVGPYVADMTTIGRGAEAWGNVVRACTGPDCAAGLRGVRSSLRELNYRFDSPPARR